MIWRLIKAMVYTVALFGWFILGSVLVVWWLSMVL
jgi:hypothetical protein